MNVNILNIEIQNFISNFDARNIQKLVLSQPIFAEVTNVELAVQILSREKSKQKLPTWFQTKHIVFPTALSIEQTSSELTAAFKSSWFSGNLMIDLTGGFGIDAYFFSKKFQKVIHCEYQTELSELVAHNCKILKVSNIQCEKVNGLDFVLNSNKNFDLIYLDPARRASQGKVFQLKDCEPNFLPNLEELMKKTQQLVIKTSPLLDISLAIDHLKYVTDIHVNSVKNDAKELIFVLKNSSTKIKLHVHAYQDVWRSLSLPIDIEKNTDIPVYAVAVKKYIYEPDVAILKAGWFKSITEIYQFQKLALHTHLYTADEIIGDFIGKIYEVQSVLDFNSLKKSRISKAHIIVKNFPMKPEILAKKYKISHGGDEYLLVYRNHENQPEICRSIRI